MEQEIVMIRDYAFLHSANLAIKMSIISGPEDAIGY